MLTRLVKQEGPLQGGLSWRSLEQRHNLAGAAMLAVDADSHACLGLVGDSACMSLR
jgi:hypothetical protein